MATANKPISTTGTKCRQYVKSLTPFKNSNGTLYAEWVKPDIYAVFSYGNHWPLFVWEDDGFGSGAWYANSDKYSPTTSKHYTQSHPHPQRDPIPLNQLEMLRLVEHGIAGVATGTPSSYEENYRYATQGRYTT